jgi:phosphatidylglycerophosphatase A
VRRHLALWLASGCYLGLIPGAPGTYASVATTLVFAAVARGSARILPELHLSAVCLLALSGTLAAADVARRRAVEDPQEVVVDEIAGQLLALWLVPATLANLALATVLFRIFDIWKPFPLRSLERLPRGVGVMADDLGAGIYANCVLQLANRVFGL